MAMKNDPAHDPLAVAQALTESLTSLATQLEESNAKLAETAKHTRTNRKIIWGVVTTLVVDVGLTLAVVTFAYKTNRVEDAATQNRANAIRTCETSNEARRAQIQLWEYILSVSAQNGQDQTPEREKRVRDFRDYVRKTFAPRDCSKL